MSLKGLGFVTKVKAYIKKPQGINSYMKKMAYGKVNLNAPSLFYLCIVGRDGRKIKVDIVLTHLTYLNVSIQVPVQACRNLSMH